MLAYNKSFIMSVILNGVYSVYDKFHNAGRSIKVAFLS